MYYDVIRLPDPDLLPRGNPFKADHTGPGMTSLKVLPVPRSMTSEDPFAQQLH